MRKVFKWASFAVVLVGVTLVDIDCWRALPVLDSIAITGVLFVFATNNLTDCLAFQWNLSREWRSDS